VVGNMLTADPRRNTNRRRVVLAFALGGIASGWGSERILEQLAVSTRTGTYGAGPAWLLPDLLLLLGLIADLAFCQGIGWLSVRRSVWRCLVAAPLVAANGYCGACAALLAGLAMFVAVDNPFTRAHPIFAALTVIYAHVIGIFVSVFVLSLALYVFAHSWNIEGWAALLVCGLGAAAISLAASPDSVRGWSWTGDLASSDMFSRVQIFLSQALYSGCAGYWLSRTPAT